MATTALGTAILVLAVATSVVIAMEGVAHRTVGRNVVFNLICVSVSTSTLVQSSKARKYVRITVLAKAKNILNT